jgi:hypothetical protein
MARYLGADGVVLSHLGGGHPMVDVMRTCKELESYGIKTVLLLMETSATQGESGFVDFVTEADAIVSTGNFEGVVHLEPVGRVVGGTHIMELGDDASGALDLSLRHIAVATSAFGVGRLRGAEV